MASPLEEGGLQYSINENNNIITIDSALFTILPPGLNHLLSCHTVMYGYDCFIFEKLYIIRI